MSTTENKKIVARFLEDFSAGNVDGAFGLMADSGTWWVGGSFPLSGKKSKKDFLKMLGDIVPKLTSGIKITVKSMVAEDDKVAVEAESQAQHKNGKRYANQYHFLFEIRDGKIHAVREYLDTMHANDVLCG